MSTQSIKLKYAVYEVDSINRRVTTTFPDDLRSTAFRDESDPVNIRQAESEGYTGSDVVWHSLVDHELLHSLVAEVMFDRPSVVLRTEAGCSEFYTLWERYQEEVFVLGMQMLLNDKGEIWPLDDFDCDRVIKSYKELMSRVSLL